MEIKQIGKQAVQLQQQPRHAGRDQADSYGEDRNRYDAGRSGEIAQDLFFHAECPDIIASSVRANSGPDIWTSRQCSEDSFSRISSPTGVSSTSTSRRSSWLVRRTTAPRSTSRSIS